MRPPKILPCPNCRSTDGPGLTHKSPSFPGRDAFRVDCPCGCRGPWAVSVHRAIEIWNDWSL